MIDVQLTNIEMLPKLAYGGRTVKINGEVTAESYRDQGHKTMNRINISIKPSVKA